MTDQPQRPVGGGSQPAADAVEPPPTPPAGPRGSSWKATLGVLAIIVAVLFGANLVNAALPLPEEPGVVDPGPGVPAQPQETAPPAPTEDPGAPAQPGATAIPDRTLPDRTLPPLGTAAPQDPGPVAPGAGIDVGAGFVMHPPDGWTVVGSEDGLTVFQKSGVLIVIGGVPWTGTASELAVAYRDAWFAGGQFTGDDPQTGEIGNGIPAAALNYTGVANGTQVDGAIITGATNGSGLLFNVFGASGALNGVSSDVDQILNTLQYTGG